MRLLDKQSINQKRSVEKKFEIDEGMKLAKKIDLLRKTASTEEANLSKFRLESLKLIKGELAELITERDDLKKEVEELRKERDRLGIITR